MCCNSDGDIVKGKGEYLCTCDGGVDDEDDYLCWLLAHYETLQDKLAQLKDARDALNVLRDEHREKRRREQEELERLRQIQMAQKLEVLRQKKQVNYLPCLSSICLVYASVA